jgi:hypothetical protein
VISIIIILLFAFRADSAAPGHARIVWTQPAHVQQTCLSRNATLIQCWRDLPPGPRVVTLGSQGPLDAAYRPEAGDVFTLALDGAIHRTTLRSVVRLPVVRR